MRQVAGRLSRFRALRAAVERMQVEGASVSLIALELKINDTQLFASISLAMRLLAPRKRAKYKLLTEHPPRDVQRYLLPDDACPSCGGKLHQLD